ncbi:hypothetical protein ACFE04_023642 [Oxalis oulophora]
MAAVTVLQHLPLSYIRSSCFCSRSPPQQQYTMEDDGRKKFMEFPYLSSSHRTLMSDLVTTMESRLEKQLQPCTLPLDAQFYENPTGSAQASLQITTADKNNSNSTIDFILGSWIHSQLPTGGELNITSLSAFLNSSTDAPNFLLELIQMGPSSMVVILDLPPRKELVLHPEYLQTFYEDTKLESFRQIIEKLPEVQPYFSSSLYIRSLTSPTAIMIRINAESGGAERLEEIVKDHLDPVARQVLGIWLDNCACGSRKVEEAEKVYLEKRDGLIKNKTIEIDLGSSFPRLFGPEVANRVLEAIREVFNS